MGNQLINLYVFNDSKKTLDVAPSIHQSVMLPPAWQVRLLFGNGELADAGKDHFEKYGIKTSRNQFPGVPVKDTIEVRRLP